MYLGERPVRDYATATTNFPVGYTGGPLLAETTIASTGIAPAPVNWFLEAPVRDSPIVHIADRVVGLSR
jgi:hypothetical protein